MRIGLLSTNNSPLLGYYIQQIVECGLSISAVILDSKSLSDRDIELHIERTANRMPPIPLAKFESLHIPIYDVENHSSKQTVDLVRSANLDILVNAGTPRILKKPIIEATRLGVLNCHPGLLPLFRGCTCVEWAIYLDEPIGNTVHLMTEKIDEGPIIALEELSFSKSDSYVDVREKVYRAGFRLISNCLKGLSEGTITPDNYIIQGDGRYFRPIDQDKMKVVFDKLRAGRYAFQQ